MLRTISHLRNVHCSIGSVNPLSRIASNTLYPPTLALLASSFSSHTQRQKTDEVYDNNFIYNKDPDKPPNLFVVQPRIRPDATLQAKLSEALNLANSLEEQRDGFFIGDICDRELPPHLVVQNPAAKKTHSDTYFGPGTVDTIKCHLNAAETDHEVDAVFVNTVLSGAQQRNLERAWGKPVLDRVGLIIEIFNAHAQTKEAKLQSELAALMYKKTRLVRIRGLNGKLTFGASGEAEVVSARGRGSGGQGFISGAGETELQLQRRRIIERRNHLLGQIEEVRRTRALQRASRRRRGGSDGQGMATVAIVGYTNAGKSTLVSALSESDVYCDDRLFATVDPRVRNVILPSGKKVLLSDTVGFISDLPVQLVEAFHATLEEVVEADLLVHVIDSSAINFQDQRSSLLEVLQQIGVSKEKLENMIEVWNKIDLRDMQNTPDEILNGDEDDFTQTEDDMEQDSLSEESVDGDNGVTDLSAEETPEDVEEPENDEWNAVDDKEDQWDDWIEKDDQQVDSSEGFKTDHTTIADPHSEDTQVVETSAVTGVGLLELLNLIDEKLNKQNVVERSTIDNFNRKWRPPSKTDTGTAVEQ